MKKTIILFFVLFLSLSVFSQNKMKFMEDTLQMKKEIISFIPIGTPLDSAKQIMIKNKFDFDGDYKNEEFLYNGKIDFLFFFHDEGAIISMDRWKVGLVYKNGKVVDVQVQFVIIGL